MISRYAPSGRFIYAFHKAKGGLTAMERSNAALEDMWAYGELSPCETDQERIYDHRRRLLGVAITVQA